MKSITLLSLGEIDGEIDRLLREIDRLDAEVAAMTAERDRYRKAALPTEAAELEDGKKDG